MFITDKEVERVISNTRNYQMAKQYYYKDYVSEIYITYNPKTKLHTIQATLETPEQNVTCRIEVNDRSKIIEHRCHCFLNSEYKACPHVGAVLFKVQELSPDNFPMHYKNDRAAKRLEELKRFEEQRKQRELERVNHRLEQKQRSSKEMIEYYRQDVEQSFIEQTEQYQIHGQLEEDRQGLNIRFKVGNQQPYLIKNIFSFLQAIQGEEVVSYGKRLTFKHSLAYFDEDALAQISFMRHLLSVPNHEVTDYKQIRITQQTLDMLFDVYHGISASQSNFYTAYKNYKPHIEIEELDDYYKITLVDTTMFLLGNYHMYTFDGVFLERIVFDETGKTLRFMEELYTEEEILVKKEDSQDFYRYVLSDITNYLQIDGTMNYQPIIPENEIKLYCEVNEQGQMQVNIEYIYEDKVISGLKENDESLSLLSLKVESYIKRYADHVDMKEGLAYFDTSKDTTFTFIQKGLPFLTKYCEIYVSDAIKKLGTKNKVSMQVGISIKNDLLSIDIDSLDIPKDELANVLSSYKQKKKFHKLKDGELLYLESEELDELGQLLDTYRLDIKDVEDGHVDMHLYRAFSMDQWADDNESILYQRSETFQDLVSNFTNKSIEPYPLSNHYQDILRDYQKEGYQWLQTLGAYGFGGILADDMGLGKTLQIIALLDQNKAEDKTSIVICPSSLLWNWEEEIHRFSTRLQSISIHGSSTKRKQSIQSYQEYDVVLTTYDYLRRDIEMYQDIEFNYIVIDEAQYIKNHKTKNATSVKQLQGKHRIALTGTPIENSLAELWSIFDFLMKDYLFSYHYFQQQYESPIVRNKDEEKQAQLKKLIEPFILRRTKKEVVQELPDKIENIMPIEFSEEEQKLYLANLAQVNTDLQVQADTKKVDAITILAMLTKLRQICCEPRVLYENIETPSSKIKSCLELISTLKENNNKALLFSSFTSVLSLLSEELKQAGISYYVLTGSTSKEERKRLVKQFQEDDTSVFLISLKAGGTGLNLTAASAVIHFDPWWNMSAQNQATDRAHRIGQEETVQVFKLIMKDSIEEKILELQKQKGNLADTFVENNAGSITSMTTDDILELFKY